MVKKSQRLRQYLFHGMSSFTTQNRPTKRAPDAGDSAHIPSSFLRLRIFLAGRLRRPHPSAGNASRWGAEPKSKTKYVFDSQRWFYVWLINSKPFLVVALFKVKYWVNIFSASRFSSLAFSLAMFSSLA
jgi:hypothetical protein